LASQGFDVIFRYIKKIRVMSNVKENFDKLSVKLFRIDFQKSVKELEEKYGVKVNLGNIRFNDYELRSKLTATKTSDVKRFEISDYRVGDVVFIDHKKVDPITTFEILKINRKNVKVRNRDNSSVYNVSPSFLRKN
jgi:hypothetical protein